MLTEPICVHSAVVANFFLQRMILCVMLLARVVRGCRGGQAVRGAVSKRPEQLPGARPGLRVPDWPAARHNTKYTRATTTMSARPRLRDTSAR